MPSNVQVLIIPGLGNSGPDHWQSLWEASDPAFQRVVQRDWQRPDLAEWLATLQRHVAACAAPQVLVAHSLGCGLVAHYAKNPAQAIKGALLVSPSDVDSLARTPDEVRSFSPMPLIRFPFPSIVVASTDDPYVSMERAEFFAKSWGSRLVIIPRGGHLNAGSGLSDWPEGKKLLRELLNEKGY